jgi:hypothetical protein
MTIAILIFAIPLILGTVLIWIGMRGYRMGDHPVCRRCGYDLFGSPRENVVCGECGGSLAAPASVVIGHRRRRPGFVIAGIVIAFPFLLSGGVGIWSAMTSTSWLHFAPVPLLDWLASSNTASTRSPALKELNARYNAGSLSTWQISSAIDAGLKYQGDLSKPWDSGWGDLIEAAQASRQLSASQWTQYETQAARSDLEIRVRPRVRIGDPLPYWIVGLGARVARSSVLAQELDDANFVWPGTPEPKPQHQPRCYESIGNGGMGSWVAASAFPAGIKPGKITVHFVATSIIGPETVPNTLKPRPDLTTRLDFPIEVELLAPEHPSVAVIHDPSLADQVRSSLTLERVYVSGGVRCCIGVHGVPVDVGFDIIIKSNGQETKIGSLACPARKDNASFDTGGGTTIGVGKIVDVVLRSDPAAAAMTTDVFSVWDGDLVYPNAPVGQFLPGIGPPWFPATAPSPPNRK